MAQSKMHHKPISHFPINYSSLFLNIFFLQVVAIFLTKISLFESLPVGGLTVMLLFVSFLALVYERIYSNRGIYLHKEVVGVFLFFLAFILFSSVFKQEGLFKIIYQLTYELRLIVFLICIVNIRLDDRLCRRITCFLKVVLSMSLFLIMLRYVDSGFYDKLFSAGGHFNNFKLYSSGGSLKRAAGLFWHPSELAAFSSWAFAWFYFEIDAVVKKKTKILLLFISSLLILLSLQRLEILFLIASIYGAINFQLSVSFKKVCYSLILVLCLAVVSYAFSDYLLALSKDYSILNPSNSNQPRIVYLYLAVLVAIDNFPFGSGLGTFASHASSKFGSYVEHQYGLSSYWWYLEGNAPYDAYWAHVVAESGFIGFSVFAIFIFTIVRVAFISRDMPGSNVRYFRKFCIMYLIGLSLGASVLMNPFYLMLFLLPLSSFSSVTRKEQEVSV